MYSSGTSTGTISPTQLLQALNDAEKLLKADQSSVRTSILSVTSKNKAAVSLKLKDPVGYEISRFTKFFARVSTVNDYPTEKLNATSCGDLLIVIGIGNFKSWLSTQTAKDVERNATCMNRYFGKFSSYLNEKWNKD